MGEIVLVIGEEQYSTGKACAKMLGQRHKLGREKKGELNKAVGEGYG